MGAVEKRLGDFFFELGALKKVKRSGWWYCGVRDPETVAEHSFRTAGMAYFLALEEGANPEHALALGLVHDWLETRLGDLNKVNARYLDTHAADEKVVQDQAKALGGKAGRAYLALAKEAIACRTKEARVAKDADLLERAFQAKEYQDLGCDIIPEWFSGVGKRLATKTARRLLKRLRKTKASDWWRRVKKV